jgi:hypothetical protein
LTLRLVPNNEALTPSHCLSGCAYERPVCLHPDSTNFLPELLTIVDLSSRSASDRSMFDCARCACAVQLWRRGCAVLFAACTCKCMSCASTRRLLWSTSPASIPIYLPYVRECEPNGLVLSNEFVGSKQRWTYRNRSHANRSSGQRCDDRRD